MSIFGTFDTHAIIFGRRLNEEMDRRGLSPQDFEDNDICAASTINGYINHQHMPNMDIAIRVAVFLGMSLDYMFGVNESEPVYDPFNGIPGLTREAPWKR